MIPTSPAHACPDGQEAADPAAHAAIGVAIYDLGRAVHDGRLTTAAAVVKLRAVDPSLSEWWARAQLGAWRTARTRYAPPDTTPMARPADPLAWRRRDQRLAARAAS